MVWDDCAGGGNGQYLALIPPLAAEQEMLQRTIDLDLFEDFTGREETLHQELKPLFGLLQNGEYQLHFSNGKTKREAVVYSGGETSTHEIKWHTAWSDSVDLSKIEKIKKDYQRDRRDTGLTRFTEGLIGYTTTSIFGYYNDASIATRAQSEIDPRKVAYFVEKIQEGARPFIIMMSAVYTPEGDCETEYAADFILDGHHKLEAYLKLNIDPPRAFITRQFNSVEELEFDIESLGALLYPWQTRHILDNLDEENQLPQLAKLDPFLPAPDSGELSASRPQNVKNKSILGTREIVIIAAVVGLILRRIFR